LPLRYWFKGRKKEEGRRKKEEGRRKKEEGRRKKIIFILLDSSTNDRSFFANSC
jgi:hypothetical protein